MKIPHLFFPLVLLALGRPLLAGGTWQFQAVHTAKATSANEDMIWFVKFEPPTDKAEVTYRVNGQALSKLPASGQVRIVKNSSVLFTYDRSKCGMTATNNGIKFLLLDYKGRSAAYKLEKTDTGKPAKITYLDEKTAMAAKTRDVLKLTQGDKSNTGITTIGILKDEIKD